MCVAAVATAGKEVRMIWVPAGVYVAVLLISLVIAFVINPDNAEELPLLAFIFIWPVSFTYVAVVTVCYWVARAIRGLWGFCFG